MSDVCVVPPVDVNAVPVLELNEELVEYRHEAFSFVVAPRVVCVVPVGKSLAGSVIVTDGGVESGVGETENVTDALLDVFPTVS